MAFSASTTQFLHPAARFDLPNDHPLPLSCSVTKLNISFSLSVLGASFTFNNLCKRNITSLAITTSKRLDVQYWADSVNIYILRKGVRTKGNKQLSVPTSETIKVKEVQNLVQFRTRCIDILRLKEFKS